MPTVSSLQLLIDWHRVGQRGALFVSFFFDFRFLLIFFHFPSFRVMILKELVPKMIFSRFSLSPSPNICHVIIPLLEKEMTLNYFPVAIILAIYWTFFHIPFFQGDDFGGTDAQNNIFQISAFPPNIFHSIIPLLEKAIIWIFSPSSHHTSLPLDRKQTLF